MKKFFVSVLVCISLCMISVCAAENTRITVSDTDASAGETIAVDVAIANNNGFGGMEFSVGFDAKLLTLITIDTAGAIAAFTATPAETANALGEVAFSYAGIANTTGDGKIATLTFTIAENAAAANIPLAVTIPQGSAFYYDGYDMLDLWIDAKDGMVQIRETSAADVDGNGKVTVTDALLLLRAILNDTAEAMPDINSDGNISIIDVLRVLKMIVA